MFQAVLANLGNIIIGALVAAAALIALLVMANKNGGKLTTCTGNCQCCASFRSCADAPSSLDSDEARAAVKAAVEGSGKN